MNEEKFKNKLTMRKIVIILSVLIFISVGCKPKTVNQTSEVILPQADTLSTSQQEYPQPLQEDTQQEKPQQKKPQKEMAVNQDSLEDVIIKTIKAYQSQNEKTLNKLILKKFGLAFVYRRGVMDQFDIADKISFDEPIPEYWLNCENIILTNYKIHFGKLPIFSCDTEKWNRPSGIYCDTINRSNRLSYIAKFRNENFESNYSVTEIKKFKEIEKKIGCKVIVISKVGEVYHHPDAFIFYLTLHEGKWYLTIIERFEPCSA